MSEHVSVSPSCAQDSLPPALETLTAEHQRLREAVRHSWTALSHVLRTTEDPAYPVTRVGVRVIDTVRFALSHSPQFSKTLPNTTEDLVAASTILRNSEAAYSRGLEEILRTTEHPEYPVTALSVQVIDIVRAALAR